MLRRCELLRGRAISSCYGSFSVACAHCCSLAGPCEPVGPVVTRVGARRRCQATGRPGVFVQRGQRILADSTPHGVV